MDEGDDDDFQTRNLSKSNVRRVYLVTYSRADQSKFPTRQSFGEQVIAYFNERSTTKACVQHWACSLERHKNTSGMHYHLCVKLSGPKRWKSVKDNMMKNHGVVLNFSGGHDNYYTAYKYVTKEDPEVYLSPGHPNLAEIGSPRTSKCIRAYRSASRKRKSSTSTANNHKEAKIPRNVKRISNLEVSDFIVANQVKDYTELLALAEIQKKEGKKELANFILSRSTKVVEELIKNTWLMKNAQAKIDRGRKNRMQLVREAHSSHCVPGCDQQWIGCAREVLRNNNIHPVVFGSALKDLLTKGRGKFRNVMLVGCADSGKSFLLNPLCKLFKTFVNPAVDKYAWVGVEEYEVIYLNDFRWSSALITWKDLLLLLEGHTVHLPAPKNQYSSDVCVDNDIPIFATSSRPIVFYGRNGRIDERETEMMSVRWKVFELNHAIPEKEQKEIEPCPRCFAELVLLDEDFST